ncbi:MAG: hypothetical protein FWD53_05125 [Phycisphaerales bacterium]|nr:hypothetical protein [Phycisphaerales bacterium]
MSRTDAVQFLLRELASKRCEGPIRIASAPGRLDVLGGLGAESGGTVAQMTLPRRVAVAVQLTKVGTLKIQSNQMAPPIEVPTDSELSAVIAWAKPLVALWQILQQAAPANGGAAIWVHGDIPIAAGQASSTATLAALATAVTSLRQIAFTPDQLAQFIRQAKRGATGRTLDATSCLLADGSRPHLFRYATQPFRLVGQVPLPSDLKVLAMDTGVRGTNACEKLNELHIASAMGFAIINTIYRDLGRQHTPLHGYLANTSPLLYRQYFRALLPRRLRGSDFVRTYGMLPTPLDPSAMYRVRTAVDHLIAEHEHAEQFLQAIEELADGLDGEERQRTMQRAGRLLLASHHSYRLRLELSCREADWLVDRLMDRGPERGIFGARITGIGGGGTVVTLADRSRNATDAILEVMGEYARFFGTALHVSEAGTGREASTGALLAPIIDLGR